MMGNCDWTLVRVMDYNFRTIMNELACVKYLGFENKRFQSVVPYGYKKIYTTEKGLPIYENQFPLPLAYTYDTVLPDSFALDECAVTRQEITMNAAIIDDDAAKECKNLNQSLTAPMLSHKLPCKIKADGIRVEGDMMYFDKKGASIELTFESDPNAETYVVYSGKVEEIDKGVKDYRSVIVTTDDVKYKYPFRTDSYATKQDQHVFNLGYHKDKITKCTLKFKLKGSMNFKDLAVYSQPMDKYEDAVKARREDILENINIHNNTITGNVDLDKDKMLLIALPYQGGWTAYVDGKEVPIYRANYQYMGLNLTKGKHDVKLHFQIDGLKKAFMITGAGMLLFLLIIIFNLVRKKRKK